MWCSYIHFFLLIVSRPRCHTAQSLMRITPVTWNEDLFSKCVKYVKTLSRAFDLTHQYILMSLSVVQFWGTLHCILCFYLHLLHNIAEGNAAIFTFQIKSLKYKKDNILKCITKPSTKSILGAPSYHFQMSLSCYHFHQSVTYMSFLS